MMTKLLCILAFFLSVSSFGQATAYPAEDLVQCGNEVFDLTVQNPIILGNQIATQFVIAYFISDSDAQANVNAVANPQAYVSPMSIIIYARVTNITDSTFDITSFSVSWNESFQVDQLGDIVTCEPFYLPPLQVGFYFTGLGGTGEQLFAGQQLFPGFNLLYVYKQTGSCVSESSFSVEVEPVTAPYVSNVTACGSYTLQPVINGNWLYYTGPSATGTLLPVGTQVTADMTVYVYPVLTDQPCGIEGQFNITFGDITVEPLSPVIACDDNGDGLATFDFSNIVTYINGLPVLSTTFYETQSDATAGVNPISSPYQNTTPDNQTIFIRTVAQGGCFAITTLDLIATTCSTISGTVRIDSDGNGCSLTDPIAAGIPVYDYYGISTAMAYTNAAGQFTFTNVIPGNHDVYLNGVSGFSAGISQPLYITSNSNYNADFCLTPISQANDASIVLYPTNNARPGFQADYNLIISNNGNSVLSGAALLNFDPAKLNFIFALPAEAMQSSNALTFNYSNLQPQQIKVYHLVFGVNLPPTVNAGDYTSFTANVSTTVTDGHLQDNDFSYVQQIVNSLDPNAKDVLQEAMLSDNTEDYLYYVVHFQNTGTAAAAKVVVADQLDSHLDWPTFRPVDASHTYSTEMDADGRVTFTFNNINLPSETQNEPASHGYVSYKVKLKQGLTVNDDIYNTANIYFDFNSPIVTNTTFTDIVAMLGMAENTSDGFAVYPNPASQFVTVRSKAATDMNISLFDVTGKKIFANLSAAGQAKVDISLLMPGMYLLKIGSGDTVTVKKLIVR